MPVKAGVIRAGARNTRRGASETFTGVVFQDIYLQNLGGTWKVIASLATPAPAG